MRIAFPLTTILGESSRCTTASVRSYSYSINDCIKLPELRIYILIIVKNAYYTLVLVSTPVNISIFNFFK